MQYFAIKGLNETWPLLLTSFISFISARTKFTARQHCRLKSKLFFCFFRTTFETRHSQDHLSAMAHTEFSTFVFLKTWTCKLLLGEEKKRAGAAPSPSQQAAAKLRWNTPKGKCMQSRGRVQGHAIMCNCRWAAEWPVKGSIVWV